MGILSPAGPRGPFFVWGIFKPRVPRHHSGGGYATPDPPPAGGVPPITPNSDFYVEDIHGPPKPLNVETWRLKISGNIDRPLTLSLDQIRKRPTLRRIITLRCIGNPVGGYALGNAEWQGLSLSDLLDGADPGFFAKTLVYHDSIPLGRARHPAARLEKPLFPYSGVFWSFPMGLPRSGRYSVSVRAADQYSGIQRDGQRDPFPSGTSGIHRIQFNVFFG